VRELGFEESVVIWTAGSNPYAPYDIESVDGDGLAIYIEVKSTSGSDPAAPFLISYSELLQAIKWGAQYAIYRVTDVDSPVPSVHRYDNPIGRLRDGTATLDMSEARMRFGDPVDDTESGER
jgi:hypothetical protein